MAQTGYTPISIYYSATATNTPTAGNLVAGELAINTADGKLFYKDSAGVVQVIGTKGGVGSSTTTQVLYNNAGTIAGSSSFVFDGTNVGIGTASPADIVDVTRSTSSNSNGGLTLTNTNNSGYGSALTWNMKLNSTAGSWGRINVETASSTATFMRFFTTVGSSLTEQMRIDLSGNLLVGATSSVNSSKFLVAGLNGSAPVFQGATGAGAYLRFYNNAQTTGDLQIGQGKASGSDNVALIYNNSNAALVFGTNGTEVARFSPTGQLTVGTTDAGQSTGVGVKIRPEGACWVVNAGTDSFSYFNSAAGLYRFYVNSAGTISATNTSINGISDIRLKENIRDLDDGLNVVMALKPRKFDWKEGKGADTKNARGFIAQEFEQVLPDLISEWKDPAPEGEEPYKSVRADLIPTLVKAIQEQQALITDLTTRLAALEGAK